MSRTSVSVVISTYNRPELLARLLSSIALQTFDRYEVIVVDDASADVAAYSKVRIEFGKKIREFRYIRQEVNQGAQRCRNLGISMAQYSLIALSDDDDEWFPEKLEKQVGVFNEDGNGVDLVYTGLVFKNEKGEIFKRVVKFYDGTPLREMLQAKVALYTSTVMIKKDCLEKVGLFDEKFRSCQDWELWIRIFALGFKCLSINEELVVYHLQDVGITHSPRSQYAGIMMLLRKHFRLYLKNAPWSLFFFFLVAMGRRINFRPLHWFKRLTGRWSYQ